MARGALAALALLLGTAWADAAVASGEAALADWSRGAASWQQVLESDQELWTAENDCDVRALQGSAPLTVLFGISTFWEHVRARRETLGSTQKALEIHVLGAAYPFEGRSDWSLLASRRPKDVPSVRVVLVLGTPWHADNVPENHEHPSLLQVQSEVHSSRQHPVAGKWSDKKGQMMCKGGGLKQLDAHFNKADFCRDHGNGLEVVCIERYYQDAAADLPKPDVAVMFSPGFPQLARRSWDQVLRKLIDDEAVIMVGDLLQRDESLEKTFRGVRPGSPWTVGPHSDEDGMTFLGMRAYGARRLGTRRAPFPLLLHRGDGRVFKNSVLQVFKGRKAGVIKGTRLPPASVLAEDAAFVRSVDWPKLFKHVEDAKELSFEYRDSLLIPTSYAYERAMRDYYAPQLQRRLVSLGVGAFTPHERTELEALGLLSEGAVVPPGSPLASKARWGPRAWVTVIRALKVGDIF